MRISRDKTQGQSEIGENSGIPEFGNPRKVILDIHSSTFLPSSFFHQLRVPFVKCVGYSLSFHY